LHCGGKETKNLTAGEMKALKGLQRNREIAIKPVDKGNAAVILDRDQYTWEGKRQLAVSEHYWPLEEPIYPQTISEVQEILEEMC